MKMVVQERTIAGYQGADAILRSAVLAFMHNLETFYRVGIEKSFNTSSAWLRL